METTYRTRRPLPSTEPNIIAKVDLSPEAVAKLPPWTPSMSHVEMPSTETEERECVFGDSWDTVPPSAADRKRCGCRRCLSTDLLTPSAEERHERCPACNSPMALVCDPADKEYWECFNCYYGKHLVPPAPPDAREAAARECPICGFPVQDANGNKIKCGCAPTRCLPGASKPKVHKVHVYEWGGMQHEVILADDPALPDAEQLRRQVAAANKGAQTNALVNKSLVEKLNALTAERDALRKEVEASRVMLSNCAHCIESLTPNPECYEAYRDAINHK